MKNYKMTSYILRTSLQTIALVLMLTRGVVPEDTENNTTSSPKQTVVNVPNDENIKDCTAENSIKEMMAQLESVLLPQGVCSNQKATFPDQSKPCFDVTSPQPVLTQLCDKLVTLETIVNGLASKISTLTSSNHNSKDDEDSNKPFTQIAKLKEELKQLKRSAAFYASWKDKVSTVDRQKLENFNTTVNSGPYFDSISGTFYTPFEGIYHFLLSYQKAPEVNLEAFLVVDNTIIAYTNDQSQPKIDILAELKSGQHVWADRTSNGLPADSEISFTFSGYFVH